jgi:sigma-B regulation protein RsbU (phosphoserine phosphatase)
MTIDSSTGETLLASAGHPPPLHISDGGCAFVEPRFGSPLGSLESEYPSRHLSLAHGDTLVLYTDGLTEAHRDRELFGEERLAEVLCGAERRNPQRLVETALEAVVSFAGELKDDVQILAVRLT